MGGKGSGKPKYVRPDPDAIDIKAVKAQKQKKVPTKVKKKIVSQCTCCSEYKPIEKFYQSSSALHKATGVLPYCKDCLQALSEDKEGNIDQQRFLKVLMTVDKPYMEALWVKAANRKGGVIGNYFRMLTLPQYKNMTWGESDLDKLQAGMVKPFADSPALDLSNKDGEGMNEFRNFHTTDEMVRLFGIGFSEEEYFHMWNKYNFLKENYKEQTSMHTEALVTYVRYKVKEELAIAANRPTDAKTWGELAMKQADKAKINPNQFSKADLQGGLTTIGEIAQAVEQNVNIIPVLPQFKYRPNDAVDFCIWNYINYARDLEGKPPVEYSEVYKFYDVAKENYIKSTGDPYGIFKDDTTESNREKVEDFITLPDEYYEAGESE